MNEQTAVLGLIDIAPNARGWGFSRYILGKRPFNHIPGLQFCKVLGSGLNGGFSTTPSLTKQGFFCVFDSAQNATRFEESSSILKAYQDHAKEFFLATVQPYSSRGSWSGFSLSCSDPNPPKLGPIASLTRASIRPSKAMQFWAKAKPAEDAINLASGKILTAGVGEAPYFRQATFTIWDNAQSLDQYAQQGAHLSAIKAAYGQAYFSESMFTRFRVIKAQGTWQGKHVQIP
jgi:spheroidene monooxygenase